MESSIPPSLSSGIIGAPASCGLVVLRQNSLSIEQIYKNGIAKKVHVVVKNHPFLLQVAVASSFEGKKLDLNKFHLEARLIYDNETFKEVAFVKLKPLEFKIHTSEKGEQATVEVKPKVLTSQLEDMLFRVKVVALDSARNLVNGLYAVSEPIKVVSKPEQVKKKKETVKTPKPVKEKEVKEKKPNDEIVSEGLDRIEKNVNQQDHIIAMLTLVTELKAQEEQQKLKEKEKECVQSKEELSPFEQQFRVFLEAYDAVDQFDRPEKIRRLMKSVAVKEKDSLSEMVDLFSEARSKPTAATPSKMEKSFSHDHSDASCNCVNCPHKEELLRIDQFYNGFLTTVEETSSGVLF